MCVGISVHAGPGSRQGTNSLYREGGGLCLAPALAMRSSKEVSGHPQGVWGLNSYFGQCGGFEAPRHGGWEMYSSWMDTSAG